MPVKKSPASFETSLTELESLVKSLEQGNLSLETALEHFERGIKLTQQCQQILTQAEQKVEKLTEKANGELVSEPFEDEED